MVGLGDRGSRGRWLAFAAWLTVALVTSGCMPVARYRVVRTPLEPTAVFTAPGLLDALAAKPVPVETADPAVQVDRWSLDETASEDGVESWPSEEQLPWLHAVEDAAATTGGNVRASRPLRCVAEQAGRFVLAKGGLPDARLRRFMAARCGAYAPNIVIKTMIATVPAGAPNERLEAEWAERFGNGLRRGVEKAPRGTRFGVWFARDEQHAGIVIAEEILEAFLDPVKVGADGTVQLSGHVNKDSPAHRIYAFVNRGERGVAPCTADEGVRPPHFRLSCALEPGDPQAWIEVLTQPENRLLGHTVARVLARRQPGPLEYVAWSAPQRFPISPETFSQRALVELNGARAASGLPPLALAARQSATNARLIPRFFDAERHHDGATSDSIALGLLAGWDVPGVIRDGSIVSGAMGDAHDATAWLSEALELPLGRSILLEPDAKAIALGATIDRPTPGVSVLVTTYKFFHANDTESGVAAVLDVIRRQRTAAGKAPPLLVDSSPLAVQATMIDEDHKHPADALAEGADLIAHANHAHVWGVYIMGNSLALPELPRPFIDPERLEVAIAVTHIKLPSAAWGQYVVLLVLLDRGMRV